MHNEDKQPFYYQQCCNYFLKTQISDANPDQECVCLVLSPNKSSKLCLSVKKNFHLVGNILKTTKHLQLDMTFLHSYIGPIQRTWNSPYLKMIYTLLTQNRKERIGCEEVSTTSVHHYHHSTKHKKSHKHSMWPLSLHFSLARKFILQKPWQEPINSRCEMRFLSLAAASSCCLCSSSSKHSPKSQSSSCFCTSNPGASRCPISCYRFYRGKECWERDWMLSVGSLPTQHKQKDFFFSWVKSNVTVTRSIFKTIVSLTAASQSLKQKQTVIEPLMIYNQAHNELTCSL